MKHVKFSTDGLFNEFLQCLQTVAQLHLTKSGRLLLANFSKDHNEF